MFGMRPVIDSSYNRVVFIKQIGSKTREKLQIKVWYPKLGKEEFIDVSSSEAFKELYNVWEVTPTH